MLSYAVSASVLDYLIVLCSVRIGSVGLCLCSCVMNVSVLDSMIIIIVSLFCAYY